MKKLLVLGLLVISQLALAAPGQPVRRMTIEQARTRVESNPIYREVERLRAAGKDILSDPAMRERVGRAVTSTARHVKALDATQHTNIMKMVNVNMLETMAELTRLSSIAQDPSSTAKQKASAVKTLELMALAGRTINTVTVNSAQARTQNTNVLKILEMSRKIASLDFGATSTAFIQKYERALREGKTVDQAIRVASNNKFGVRELRECQ